MPVAGFQSANGDLKKDRLDVGAAAPSVARGLLVMRGMTPPGTTPSEVCNGTGAMLCSTPKLLVAPWLFCVNSLLGLNRCLKLLRVTEGACNSPDWVRSAPLLARKGTFASKSGGPGPMPAASPILRHRASLDLLSHIMQRCVNIRHFSYYTQIAQHVYEPSAGRIEDHTSNWRTFVLNACQSSKHILHSLQRQQQVWLTCKIVVRILLG